MADRLYRSRDDRMLAGVAAGVAEALDADPSVIRIAWALLAIFTGGIAFVVYIVMAIVVPENPGEPAPWAPAGSPPATPTGPGPGVAEPTPMSAAPAAPEASSWDTAATSAPGGETAFLAGAQAAPDPISSAQPSWWADDRDARRAARRARRAAGEPGRGGLVVGAVLIILGAFFLLREFAPWFDWNLWWPIALIGLGALLLVVALSPGRRPD